MYLTNPANISHRKHMVTTRHEEKYGFYDNTSRTPRPLLSNVLKRNWEKSTIMILVASRGPQYHLLYWQISDTIKPVGRWGSSPLPSSLWKKQIKILNKVTNDNILHCSKKEVTNNSPIFGCQNIFPNHSLIQKYQLKFMQQHRSLYIFDSLLATKWIIPCFFHFCYLNY